MVRTFGWRDVFDWLDLDRPGARSGSGLGFSAKGSSSQSVIAIPGFSEPGHRTCLQVGETFVLVMLSMAGTEANPSVRRERPL
jgi:hypothetical protein